MKKAVSMLFTVNTPHSGGVRNHYGPIAWHKHGGVINALTGVYELALASGRTTLMPSESASSPTPVDSSFGADLLITHWHQTAIIELTRTISFKKSGSYFPSYAYGNLSCSSSLAIR